MRWMQCAPAIGLAAALIGLAPAAPQAMAQERADGGRSAENAAAANEFTAEMEPATQRALAWLAEQQNPDGSFTGGARYGRHVGITALACLAFMADGHIPGRGGYGEVVSKGLDFVLDNLNETGLLAADTSHGPMYGHGFATLFLGEVYGMTGGGPETEQSRRLYEALVKAVRLIVQTQNSEGGWRYNPVPYDADISVTICEIMALRSARNAGIDVPKETIDRAVEYVRLCQNPDGGFKYQLTTGGSAWPRSAAGIASLYYAGIYEDEAIDRGLGYLQRTAMPGRRGTTGAHYFYGHYYAVQAMYLAGGDHWAEWWPAIREELLESQTAEGYWDDPHAGQSYGTAMALIILQMPKRYLPIFQK
ncbi:MAG: prenyltransferase/squalene oxidase repeat-containing protein [Planctomycetota bacterium]|nr:prenyltransferase/squalene oxidase repeat-containing protein [Planctomycetota bacterium]